MSGQLLWCLKPCEHTALLLVSRLGIATWKPSMTLPMQWAAWQKAEADIIEVRMIKSDLGLFFRFLSCLCVGTTKINACGFMLAFSCKIASRFESTYVHSCAPCLHFEHGLWAISTHGPAKPKLANHLLRRMKLSASWLPQAQLYLTNAAGGLH